MIETDTDADVKEGKYQYDRVYLFKLREHPASQKKPAGLPNLEIILDQPWPWPWISFREKREAPLDFTPIFFETSNKITWKHHKKSTWPKKIDGACKDPVQEQARNQHLGFQPLTSFMTQHRPIAKEEADMVVHASVQDPNTGMNRPMWGKGSHKGSWTSQYERPSTSPSRSLIEGESQNSSRDNSWNQVNRCMVRPQSSKEGDIVTQSDAPLCPNKEIHIPLKVTSPRKKKSMTEEEMELRSKNIMEEYLNVNMKLLNEAKQHVIVLKVEGEPFLHLFVTSNICHVLEKSDETRVLTGHFFHELVQSKIMPLETYFKGLTEVLKFAEDVVIDMLWAYIAQFIVPLLMSRIFDLSQLYSVLKPSLEDKSCALLLAQILKQTATILGVDAAALMWQNSGLDWSMLIDPEEIDKFVQSEKVMFSAAQSQHQKRFDSLNRSVIVGGSQNSSHDNTCMMGTKYSEEVDIMTPSGASLLPSEEFHSLQLPTATARKRRMAEEEMEFRSQNILDEYVNPCIKLLNETEQCVKELDGEKHIHLFVTSCIKLVLEKSNQTRILIGQFFHELVQKRIMTLETFVKGLIEVLKIAEDMVNVISNRWVHIAQMITPLVIGQTLELSQLKSVFKPHLQDSYCALLLAQILLQASVKLGNEAVAMLWQNSGLEWSMYILPDDVGKFVQNEKVEFSVVPVSGAPAISLTFFDGIKTLIHEKTQAKAVTAYIENNFRGNKNDKCFIRELTTTLVSASLTEHLKVVENVFKECCAVLQICIGISNQDLALQVLYAIQALMSKLDHPPGVIDKLFNSLYENDVLMEETFHQWNTSTDPNEQEGRGVCMLQVAQFITWLQENDLKKCVDL